LPGKPLADICGRPMIEHVYRRAAMARGVTSVLVATDDPRIARAVETFGGTVVMTRADHQSGTDRIAEVAGGVSSDILVNVQGDEPLLNPGMIEQVVSPFTADQSAVMATLGFKLDPDHDSGNPNVVKVVVDLSGHALYFTRSAVPYPRTAPASAGVYRHVGIYAYRRDFLLALSALPRTPLERTESLEQLRVLEHGYRIHVVETTHESVSVDTPDDLERVRQLVADGLPA
jgi:3-deoxy-manno-octulosonate cytidylyltransferase (CMP-KDO synthetase)